MSDTANEFRDDFTGDILRKDPEAIDGWAYYSGDGNAAMDFKTGNGTASITVDSTADKRNVWWAIIRRCVSADLDLSLLEKPGFELRIEARIRSSHAPRRVNMHLQTQQTQDFHSHLMEFDIPDTTNWHTISMTTVGFDAVPGDRVFGQLALMDWGIDRFRVDIEYFSVKIVDTASAGPDRGEPVPYHPPIPDPSTFSEDVPATTNATVDAAFPDVNLSGWHARSREEDVPLLNAGGSRSVILRWDLRRYAGKNLTGSGLLELTTYSLERTARPIKDFGLIRVVEILAGNPAWAEGEVTFERLLGGRPEAEALCPQMVIDYEVAETPGEKTLLVIPKPVLERLLNGRTLGLAVRPLGSINASFYAGEYRDGVYAPRLRFNAE